MSQTSTLPIRGREWHLVDGYQFHSGRKAFDNDRRRIRALNALGWRTIPVTATALSGDPAGLERDIRLALGDRASG